MRVVKIQRLSLAVLLVVVAAIAVSACSGGGGSHPIEPCCGATGVTEAPASVPFAPVANNAAAGDLTAQAFLFDTANCPVMVASDAATYAATFSAVGDPSVVAADGSYTVTLPKDVENRPVGVRVFRQSDHTTLGVGLLSINPAAANEGGSIQVPPIRFLVRVGETTLESAVFCKIRNTGVLSRIVFADVRASITRLSPRDTDAALLNSHRYLDALVQAMTQLADDTERAKFATVRENAELAADVTRAEAAPGTAGLDLAIAEARFDAYMAGLGTLVFADGNSGLKHAQGLVQQFAQGIQKDGQPDPAASPLKFALYKHEQLARARVTEAGLLRGVALYTHAPTIDPTAPVPSPTGTTINGEILALKARIRAAQTTQDIGGAWGTFVSAINANVATQTGLSPTTLGGIESNAHNDGVAAQNQFDFDTSWTHEEILGRFYDPTNSHPGSTDVGTWTQVQNAVDASFNTQIISATDRAALTDIIFYTNANQPNF